MIPAFIADKANRKRRGDDDIEHRVGASISSHADRSYDVSDDIDDDDNDDSTVVYRAKGGGSPAPQPSPMEEARAQIELERQRAIMQQENEARIRAQQEAERQATIQKAAPLQAQAYNSALDYGNQQSGARGFDQGLVDKYGLLGLYTSDIDRQKMGIAEDNLNPGAAYNTKTSFADALNTALGTYRGDLTRQLNSIAGENIGYNTFADTADDDILSAILGERRADAMATIDAAKARGQLNDAGYARAISGLDRQGSAAMSDLQDLGLGVLSKYREQLGGLRNNALTSIGSTDFSNPYSFDTFKQMLADTTGSLQGRLQGDISRATEGKSFFDPSSIITQSGAVQGYYNPTATSGSKATQVANPLLTAFTTQEQNKQNNPVSNGVF